MSIKAPSTGRPRNLSILYAAAEAFPFVKVGGLADVAGALPKALAHLGHKVRLILPKYSQIDQHAFGLTGPLCSVGVPMAGEIEEAHIYRSDYLEKVEVFFIESEKYFGRENVYGYPDDDERFIFFSKSVLKVAQKMGWRPHIVHCNDWHTAIIPSYLRLSASEALFTQPASVLTIHNLAYQGPFSQRTLEVLGVGPQELSLNLMARGILSADVVNTVSPGYALEIRTPEYGMNLDSLLRTRGDRLCGILNGVDYEEFNPATDPHIPTQYDENTSPERIHNKRALESRSSLPRDGQGPLLGMVSRLDDQKGLELVGGMISELVALNARLVVMGVGDGKYERLLKQGAAAYPQHLAYHPTADEGLARCIYAGCDFLLYPSNFEPCGLGPLIALRYGAIPIVRRTGGLADSIPDYSDEPERGLGFSFVEKKPSALLAAVGRALAVYRNGTEWSELIKRAMRVDYSWSKSVKEYERLYSRALAEEAKGRILDKRSLIEVRHPVPPPITS